MQFYGEFYAEQKKSKQNKYLILGNLPNNKQTLVVIINGNNIKRLHTHSQSTVNNKIKLKYPLTPLSLALSFSLRSSCICVCIYYMNCENDFEVYYNNYVIKV